MKREARDMLLAIAIGDGYINPAGSLGITHCEAQLEYMIWKCCKLTNLNISVGDISEINNNGYPGNRVYIGVTKWGKLLRRILYPAGIKNIHNRKILNRLQAVHIAIWYMDDGSVSQKKRNGIVHASDLVLNTHTTYANNIILIEYFKEVWGISFTQALNRGHYRIRCGTIEARKFLKIVEPYLLEVKCMSHKLNIKPEPARVLYTGSPVEALSTEKSVII